MMNTFLLFLFLGFGCVFIAECQLSYENSLTIYNKVCSEDKDVRDDYMKCFDDNLSKEAIDVIKEATNTESLLEATEKLCNDAVMIAKVCDMLSRKSEQLRFDAEKDGPKMLKCLLD